jgi:hypothetical protein
LERGEQSEFPPGFLAGAAASLRRELEGDWERNFAWVEILGLALVWLLLPATILGFFLPLYQLIGNLG